MLQPILIMYSIVLHCGVIIGGLNINTATWDNNLFLMKWHTAVVNISHVHTNAEEDYTLWSNINLDINLFSNPAPSDIEIDD